MVVKGLSKLRDLSNRSQLTQRLARWNIAQSIARWNIAQSTYLSMYAFVPNYLPMFTTTSNPTSKLLSNVTFQIPSKCFSKDLKEKVVVSLLRRHSENDWTIISETYWNEWNENLPSQKPNFCNYLQTILVKGQFLQTDYCDEILQRLAVKACCETRRVRMVQ